MVSDEVIDNFLVRAGWGAALRDDMPADFSSRRYARLTRRPDDKGEPRSAYLMMCGADQKPELFVALAQILVRLGLSAPQIYAAEVAQGLILMEDFGGANFGAMQDAGADPLPLYERGLEVLIHLHDVFTMEAVKGLDLPLFDAALFTTQAELFLDFYFPFVKGRAASLAEREGFRSAWLAVLPEAVSGPQVFLLRDYMLDNLMSLPDRQTWRDAGVLDFQDGGIGPLAYDVASLAECVRRDHRMDVLGHLIDLYVRKRGIADAEAFRRSCFILSAQRHTRTLGNVARRAEKRVFLPRMEAYLRSLLEQPCLAPVAAWYQKNGIL